MDEYHKINTVYKRNPEDMKHLLEGEFALPEFEYLQHNKWVFTEKIDGTNIRVMWDGKAVTFGGKTDKAQIPVPLVTALNLIFSGTEARKVFEEFPDGVCLYGEGFGKGIQSGGKYMADGVDFVLFDVRVGHWWLKREDVMAIANKFEIKSVPIIGEGTLADIVSLVKLGFKSRWGDFVAEGVVARPEVELKARNGERIIVKVKHKDFI